MSSTLVHWCLGFGGWIGVFLGVGILMGLPNDMGFMRYAIVMSMPFVVGIGTLLVAQASIAFSHVIMLTLNSMYSIDTMMSVVACLCCSLAVVMIGFGSLMAIQIGRFNRLRKQLAEHYSSNETSSESVAEEAVEAESVAEEAEEESEEEADDDSDTVSQASSQTIDAVVEETAADHVDQQPVQDTHDEAENTMEIDPGVVEAALMLELMRSIDRDINNRVNMEEMD
jgi:hypothetical protein